jgi:hypothetical protein
VFENSSIGIDLPEPPRSAGSAGISREQMHTSLSGATSSYKTSNTFHAPRNYRRYLADRFAIGNVKHENGTTVYAEANWLKALRARDVEFFRNRAVHAENHGHDEMRGIDDPDPGGNIGAELWFWSMMAYVSDVDPEFYQAIRGKRHQKYSGNPPKLDIDVALL